MKTLRAFVLLTLLGIQAHANDSESLLEVQEKRKAILENIVKFLERQHGLGEGNFDDLINARIRLNKFYRNHAPDPEQERTFQAKIVNLEKSRLLSLQRDLGQGIEGVSRLKVMRAEERFLAAKQRYLRVDAKKNQAVLQGADQPASAPESKPEADKKHDPESELRPQ